MKLASQAIFSCIVVGIMVFGFGGLLEPSVVYGQAGQLQPIPQQSPTPAATPSNGPTEGSPFANETTDGAGAATAEEYDDFEGMPVCSPPGRFWLRADYLMWWTNGTSLPPLVSTGPLGQVGSNILYGNETIGIDGRSGYRTTIGMWLDCCHIWNLEFDYLSLGDRSDYFSQTSTGNPPLMRPFFDVQSNVQSGELVASTGIVAGSVSVDTMDYFQSGGALLSYNLCGCDSCNCCSDPCEDSCCPLNLFCCRTDLLVGFRFYELYDRINIQENLLITQPGPAQGTTFLIDDNFSAKNEFYGSEFGLRTNIYRGRWSLEVLTKIAMGNNHQTITITGQQVKTVPGQAPVTYDDGIFAGPSNEGVYQRDSFTVIPQLGLELGYQVSCHLRAYVGYNIIYWGCVARAADQIDLNVDPRNWPPQQAGALPFPQFPGQTSCFWAQGINVGGELRF